MSKVIWTNHLYDRIKQRGLDPKWVDNAVRFPDKVIASSTTDSRKHIKLIKGKKIVAAVKRIGGDWLITSAWEDQHSFSSKNYHKYHRSFLENWIDLLLKKIERYLFK